MKNSDNNKKSRLTDEILELLKDDSVKVTNWLRKNHHSEVQLGEFLESAWEKLERTPKRGEVFKAWVNKTMGHKKTKAADARKLYNLRKEFEDDLAKVASEYLATIKTSQLRYALSKLKARKMSEKDEWDRDINLKDIDFQREAILLYFDDRDEAYDLQGLTFAKLKSLIDPKYAPPTDPKSFQGLLEREAAAKKTLENIQQQIKEFTDNQAAA